MTNLQKISLGIGCYGLLPHKKIKNLFLLTCLIISSLINAQTAFPEAEGFGKNSVGGRGGSVYIVTNLNNDGPGSFREACEASGARTVVFAVSGIINLSSNLVINNDNLTIAGQTAPGDGICIKGAGFIVQASNIIVRYMRFRLGDNGYKDENGNIIGTNSADVDTVGVYGSTGGTTDIIFDHCSMSWSIDEIIGIYGSSSSQANGVNNITFQYCMFSEALSSSHHDEGSHSMSFLINKNSNNITIYKNLFANSVERHIRAGGGCSFEMINNLVYNFKYTCVISPENEFSMVNNHYKEGNLSISSSRLASFVSQNGYDEALTKAYILGNTTDSGLNEMDPDFDPYLQSIPPLDSGIIPDDNASSITDILDNSGAILPVRDSVDNRAVNAYINNTGNIIDTQEEVGGYPEYNSTTAPQDTDSDGMPDFWEIENSLDINDPSDRNITQPDGYTNLEYYLNGIQFVHQVDAGLDQTICENETTILTANGADSYLWSTGETTASINVTPLVTTTYSVTGTHTSGEETTDNVDVFVNPLPTANAGTDQTICEGESATLTASGGDAYLWNTGETTQSIAVNPTATTNYSVIVTQNGCEATDDVIVTVNPLPTANAGVDVTINNGDSTTLTASGGGTYLWNTGETTANITVSPTATTTYSVTVTQTGCEATDDVIVTVNSTTVTANAGADQTICEGESATLTASGGTDYLWSTGETTASITVSPTTTTNYSVTVTEGANSDTDDVDVFVNLLPTANAGTDQTICEGESAILTASGGDTYLWNTGETTQSITVNSTTTTNYSVTVTQNGCEATDDVIVTVNPLPTANAGTDVTINEGESTTLTASGGGTYLWNTGETTASITVSPTTTTAYSVTVFQNDCEATDNVIVTVNSATEVTANAGADQNICDGDSITLTASGGTDYLWSTGETTASITVSPNSTTNYTVIVSNSTSSDSDEVTVEVNPLPEVQISDNATILEGNYITLSATGANNYEWSNGATEPNIAVSPGVTTTYMVTGYINDCYDVKDVTVSVVEQVFADAGEDTSICLGDAITLTATSSGGEDYLWNTGETTQEITVSPLETSTYTVIVSNELDADASEVTVNVENCEIEPPIIEDIYEYKLYTSRSNLSVVNVRLNGIEGEAKLHIHDISGKIIKTINIADNDGEQIDFQVNTSFYSKGIYFFTLKEQDKTTPKQILIK